MHYRSFMLGAAAVLYLSLFQVGSVVAQQNGNGPPALVFVGQSDSHNPGFAEALQGVLDENPRLRVMFLDNKQATDLTNSLIDANKFSSNRGAAQAPVSVVEDSRVNLVHVQNPGEAGLVQGRVIDCVYHENFRIVGVVTLQDDLAVSAGRLADKYGLVGPSEQAAWNAYWKPETRKLWKQAGLPTPEFASFATEMGAKNFARKLILAGKEAVIKPSGYMSSVGVQRMSTFGEVADRVPLATAEYREALHSRSREVVTGGDLWLVEEYIPSRFEVMVDSLTYKGETQVIGMFLKTPLEGKGGFIEHVFITAEGLLPQETIDRVYQLNREAIAASGIKNGHTHFEARVTPEGKIFPIEIGPRPAGGAVPHALQLANGFNIYRGMLQLALGSNPFDDPKNRLAPSGHTVAVRVLYAPKSGERVDIIQHGALPTGVKLLGEVSTRSAKLIPYNLVLGYAIAVDPDPMRATTLAEQATDTVLLVYWEGNANQNHRLNTGEYRLRTEQEWRRAFGDEFVDALLARQQAPADRPSKGGPRDGKRGRAVLPVLVAESVAARAHENPLGRLSGKKAQTYWVLILAQVVERFAEQKRLYEEEGRELGAEEIHDIIVYSVDTVMNDPTVVAAILGAMVVDSPVFVFHGITSPLADPEVTKEIAKRLQNGSETVKGRLARQVLAGSALAFLSFFGWEYGHNLCSRALLNLHQGGELTAEEYALATDVGEMVSRAWEGDEEAERAGEKVYDEMVRIFYDHEEFVQVAHNAWRAVTSGEAGSLMASLGVFGGAGVKLGASLGSLVGLPIFGGIVGGLGGSSLGVVVNHNVPSRLKEWVTREVAVGSLDFLPARGASYHCFRRDLAHQNFAQHLEDFQQCSRPHAHGEADRCQDATHYSIYLGVSRYDDRYSYNEELDGLLAEWSSSGVARELALNEEMRRRLTDQGLSSLSIRASPHFVAPLYYSEDFLCSAPLSEQVRTLLQAWNDQAEGDSDSSSGWLLNYVRHIDLLNVIHRQLQHDREEIVGRDPENLLLGEHVEAPYQMPTGEDYLFNVTNHHAHLGNGDKNLWAADRAAMQANPLEAALQASATFLEREATAYIEAAMQTVMRNLTVLRDLANLQPVLDKADELGEVALVDWIVDDAAKVYALERHNNTEAAAAILSANRILLTPVSENESTLELYKRLRARPREEATPLILAAVRALRQKRDQYLSERAEYLMRARAFFGRLRTAYYYEQRWLRDQRANAELAEAYIDERIERVTVLRDAVEHFMTLERIEDETAIGRTFLVFNEHGFDEDYLLRLYREDKLIELMQSPEVQELLQESLGPIT